MCDSVGKQKQKKGRKEKNNNKVGVHCLNSLVFLTMQSPGGWEDDEVVERLKKEPVNKTAGVQIKTPPVSTGQKISLFLV